MEDKRVKYILFDESKQLFIEDFLVMGDKLIHISFNNDDRTAQEVLEEQINSDIIKTVIDHYPEVKLYKVTTVYSKTTKYEEVQ